MTRRTSLALQRSTIAGACLMLAVGCSAESDVSLESEDQRLGYAMGKLFADRIQQDMQDLNSDAFMAGVRDSMKGNEPRLSDEQIQKAVSNYQKRLQDEATGNTSGQQSKSSGGGDAEENLAASRAFLEKNRQRDGVKTTDSGLQYEVIEEGDGESPAEDDRVTVHYTGELIDGTVFDSSRERGEPATFGLQQVIPGWTEGLQLMNEGDRYRFYIPPQLAYGENGPPSIGPNQALIFDVELIEVQ
ncbi:peptidylprolyl isomerase [Halovibrio salipaludis]|uniref:Peptidyl-prolyl cis-trans isomerase n=1 Tax=Halovibrio salipaludis TaxID=2032626 RepID=A0A2A2FBA6_9GAMM|nr:FKBP-type peptidyl-prolyl cis-trans isomerase [Halovibrio salipaludis]PAU82238.1 peptidylprolyl isomerase [Halovibrio salipaludis]